MTQKEFLIFWKAATLFWEPILLLIDRPMKEPCWLLLAFNFSKTNCYNLSSIQGLTQAWPSTVGLHTWDHGVGGGWKFLSWYQVESHLIFEAVIIAIVGPWDVRTRVSNKVLNRGIYQNNFVCLIFKTLALEVDPIMYSANGYIFIKGYRFKSLLQTQYHFIKSPYFLASTW